MFDHFINLILLKIVTWSSQRKYYPRDETQSKIFVKTFSEVPIRSIYLPWDFNPIHTGGGGHICPTTFISSFISKNFPATYDETLCKFLLYTYEDSRNLFWSKKLSRGHVEHINVAWVENCKNKNCNFRVLRGILEEFLDHVYYKAPLP